ncbi:MAG: DUF3298 and DUF4163 domain-containing protein [Clostridiaceae bacterium]|nr:DUF3298 and DUF4163 domain-containing protein [Clostridiaceae bacterium]
MSYIQLPVQIIPRKITEYNLEVFYPAVVGGVNPEVMQKINREILDLVNHLITEQGYFQEPKTTQVNGYFEIKTNERGVLSLSIINYTYRYHAAHGMTIIKSLTFDIESGKVYELGELFKPESDYLKKLSDIVLKQIKEREIDLLGEFKPVKPNQDYYIADKSLVIYYQLYEITPYVFGFPQFPISVYEIQDIINEDGPLGVMLING